MYKKKSHFLGTCTPGTECSGIGGTCKISCVEPEVEDSTKTCTGTGCVCCYTPSKFCFCFSFYFKMFDCILS